MFTKLRNRMLLLNMAIISIVMVAAIAVIYSITYAHVQKENQRKLQSVPSALLASALTSPDPDEPHLRTRVFVGRIPVDYAPSFAVALDRDGAVTNVFSYIDMPGEFYRQIVERTWNTNKRDGTLVFEDRKWQYQISSPDNRVLIREDGTKITIFAGGDHGQYQISFLDITESSNTLRRLLASSAGVGVAMLFCLFGVSLHFANASIRPIADSWEKQKQFVADASHELKTPLAIISANADALLADGNETANGQRKWADYIRSEAARMGKLVNDMLYLARVEAAPPQQNAVDISWVAQDALASMEAILFEKGINLTQAIEPGITVKGDGEQLKQAVLALLDNAAKYAGQDGDVNVTLRKLRNQAVFSVRNSGEGIPPDKLPRVFDRFYRIDPSRSQGTGGYGLGLSIAKAIIERSGGSIHAESAENRTTFWFVLKTGG